MAPQASSTPNSRVVGAGFESIVEGFEVAVAVAALQSERDQAVGERGVLGQDGAVEVAAEGIAVAGAFKAANAVVAEAAAHAGERRRCRAEVGTASMVLEADERATLPLG